LGVVQDDKLRVSQVILKLCQSLFFALFASYIVRDALTEVDVKLKAVDFAVAPDQNFVSVNTLKHSVCPELIEVCSFVTAYRVEVLKVSFLTCLGFEKSALNTLIIQVLVDVGNKFDSLGIKNLACVLVIDQRHSKL
jgi:hypothetical protein